MPNTSKCGHDKSNRLRIPPAPSCRDTAEAAETLAQAALQTSVRAYEKAEKRFGDLRAAIVKTLNKHPEAKIAVREAYNHFAKMLDDQEALNDCAVDRI